MAELTLVGRSSSHFTRVARIFALELGVEHAFRPVLDLSVVDPGAYAGNPALKVPVLVDERGPLFGTENVCRELARRSGRRASVVLRGDVAERFVANAEELTVHVMSAEVSLIMAKVAGDARLAPPKARASIEASLDWLEENLEATLGALPPDRSLSFVEAALFAVVRHLPFRDVLDVAPWPRLGAFCDRFEARAGAAATPYRYDAG